MREDKVFNRYVRLIGFAVVLIASFVMKNYYDTGASHEQKAGIEFFTVDKVVDGDTLKLSDGSKVRLIGIDTPETHYSSKLVQDAKRSRKDIKTIQGLGKKASAFTKNLCYGRRVSLKYDVQKKDRYGRLLSYVYLDDGTFVNAKIIEEGYAQAMTIPPNVKFSEYFLRLEREARTAKRGLWHAGSDEK